MIINWTSFRAYVLRMQLSYISQFFSISQLICPQIPAITDRLKVEGGAERGEEGLEGGPSRSIWPYFVSGGKL